MDKTIFFWGGFEPLLRIVVVGTLTYIGIVLILRFSGKRTLASMNAFDFIITVAMGSAFGRILTAQSVSVSEAITAFLLLVCLQFLFSFFELRSKRFSKLMSSRPTLLFYNGKFVEKNMKKQRLQKTDLMGMIRQKKYGSMEQIEAIIFESNGSISVIGKSSAGNHSTLDDVPGC